MKNATYLTWQQKVPTRPGLYIRTDGHGGTTLVLVSTERFIDGSLHAKLTHVSDDYVRERPTPIHEVLHRLPGSSGKTHAKFLGPIKLPRVPSRTALSRATRDQTPASPGIYFVSRDLGHAWTTSLVAISIHRYQAGESSRDELFALELPSLENHNLEKVPGIVITPALPAHRKLNLQQLPK